MRQALLVLFSVMSWVMPAARATAADFRFSWDQWPKLHRMAEGPAVITYGGDKGEEPLQLRRELFDLVPATFYFARNEAGWPIADQVTLKIFQSPTARRALCFLASESSADVSRFLGVSPRAGAEIVKLCRGSRPLSAGERGYFQHMKNHIFPGASSNQAAKSYVFFFSPDFRPKIEGFTGSNGLTLVVLNPNEMTAEHWIRLFAHEIAMSFDQLSAMGDRSQWDYGVNVLYSSQRRFGSLFDSPFVTPENVAELNCALMDPAIRYGAAAERAFQFEDLVLSELGLNSQALALVSHLSCQKTLGTRALQMAPLASFLTDEIRNSDFYNRCGGFELLKDADRGNTLVSRIRRIDATVLKLNDGSSTAIPLCDLLLHAQIGPHAGDWRHGGPRPSVNGWGGN